MLDTPDPVKTWCNQNGASYYEKVPISAFEEYAERVGLAGGCDVDLIYPAVKTKGTLLEVGAGYGRVIGHLLRHDYQGQITAIERSYNFHKTLIERYQNKIAIIHDNIETLTLKERFGAILWMWGNVSEWPKSEQLSIIQKMTSWLEPSGLLIMDIIDPTHVPMGASYYQNQSYVVPTDYGDMYGYNPTVEGIETYGKALGLTLHEVTPYTTTADRRRCLLTLGRR